MSAEAMAWVLGHSQARRASRLVAFAIANQIAKDTGEGWAYVADICAGAAVSEDTYARAVANLVELGELERVVKAGGSSKARPGRRPNLYRMPLFADALRPPQQGGVTSDPTPATGGGRRPPQQGGVVLGTVQGTVQTLFEDDFDAFWFAYPRKVGKPIAQKAWIRAIKRADPKRIMAGLSAQAAGWKAAGTETRFIPHPTSWLNADAWNDEPEAVVPGVVAAESLAVNVVRVDCSECGGSGWRFDEPTASAVACLHVPEGVRA